MKRIVIGIVSAVVGLAVAATVGLSLLPDTLKVQRTRVVNGSPSEVSHYLAHYPDRRQWVIWTELDPAAEYDFSGRPGAPGATMHWAGEEIGTATLTLESVSESEVVSNLTYTAPFTMSSTDHFALEDLGDGSTRVTWTATGPLAWGPERVFGVFADGILGPEYEVSLDRLDALLARG